jgi:hypothetical protein
MTGLSHCVSAGGTEKRLQEEAKNFKETQSSERKGVSTIYPMA